MNELKTGYYCGICDQDFFSTAETQVTVTRKEYANEKSTTTTWSFRVCDECLKKLVEQ